MEVAVSGTIAGVPVRGIADLVTAGGTVIDIKTAARKPSGLAADHALRLATYAGLLDGACGRARLDTLVATKEPQQVQMVDIKRYRKSTTDTVFNQPCKKGPLAPIPCRAKGDDGAAGVGAAPADKKIKSGVALYTSLLLQ